MSLVAFVSGRSPGLTTAVYALGATWPEQRRPIVAELDPAGGSLAARHELPAEPGLTTLAAAGRRGLAPRPSCGTAAACQVASSRWSPPSVLNEWHPPLAVLGEELAQALDSIPGTDVLADCGRIERRSPALDLVRAAPYVVLVVTPSLEGVAHAQARLESLALPPGRLAVADSRQPPLPLREVGAALELPVLGALAYDPAGVARFNAGQLPRRCDLRRSAASIARGLVRFLPPVAPVAGPLVPPPASSFAPPPTPGPPPAVGSPPALGPLQDHPAAQNRSRRPSSRKPGPVGAAVRNSRP